MPLTVETGAVVAEADSYVTLDAYRSYGAARGWTIGSDEAADEANLRRAFDGINRLWTYLGEELSSDQEGAFPRDAWSGIPRKVQHAQCELAHLIQEGLDPFATIGANTTKETVKVGPISIGGGESLPVGRPRLVAVEGLLASFLAAGTCQMKVQRG
ncbi:DnaT-like ssDNA-binding protein [Thalassovita sp.]|jgi:hypothetical protein|uniref:DnaT-like ssDNA-binding protein n=1 Tax=Thalassovita sp. TaxID=1979401 RepID=UPI002AB17BC5|nr:DnaT-like ssDNA-binding protein [Thalassovita sp.]